MAFTTLNLNLDLNSYLGRVWEWLQLCRPKSGIEKLEKEMARLRGKRDDIKNQINEVEREGKFPTNEVSQWLRDVDELEGQVADINQDFQSIERQKKRRRVEELEGQVADINQDSQSMNQTDGASSSNRPEAFATNTGDEENTPSQTQQAGDDVPIRESSNCGSIIWNVAKKLDKVNELMSRAGALDPIATVGPPEPIVMLPISHRPPVGIESDVEDIVGYINNGGEDNIIGIYGMGGVGKTTMLKTIRRRYHNHEIFDSVIWVVASKDCQLKRLQKDIAEWLGLKTLQENDDEKACGYKLFSYLKNKKCLLFLDDIWENLDLQLLGMAHSATQQGQQHHQRRKVVVFTTRNETVCEQMEAEKKIQVKCLDPDRAWQLFEQNSDKRILNSDGGIKSVAQELVKECAGLPLALITIARAMSGKKSWETWNDTLRQIKDEHQWTTVCLPKDSVVMYKAFKLSYDSLENDSIRECLLCCALWPEDYEIHTCQELIECWIGCGIIREFNVISEAFTKGFFYLEALVTASLLLHSRDFGMISSKHYVKMHDVIRDLTLFMVPELRGNGQKWIVKAGIGLSHLPRQEEWQEAERASFMSNNITSIQDYGASTFPNLSMLFLHDNEILTTISPGLFASMPRLTYLNLSKCGITKLPLEIHSLTKLQYLNLSKNPIRRLPVQLCCLDKLEYLLLRGTKLETVPKRIISKLSMLKWLDIREIYPKREWWWDELEHFRGRHQISLGVAINLANFKRLDMLPNVVSVWDLAVSGLKSSEFSEYDLDTLQWSCRVRDSLEFLDISCVSGENFDCKSSFRCLRNLTFRSLGQLEKMWLNGVGFNNLRNLFIVDCPKLKDVSWILQLPCLNYLEMTNCEEIEELISNVGNSSSFNIKILCLWQMTNLHRIAHRPLSFPYLEDIDVCECPRFKKLPFGIEISKSLKEIGGESTWWHNLDWDDENTKAFLTPYFRDRSTKSESESLSSD